MAVLGLAVLAALLITGQAGPLFQLHSSNNGACATTCTGDSKFNYRPGTVYEFNYNAETRTKMNGASEDSAFMVIDANVEIEPLTRCDLVMRIKDASLRDSDGAQQSREFRDALKKQPLRFSFQDGKIEQVCPSSMESTWALNIKRGILSAFQNSMESFERNQNLTETDVTGTCLTEYTVSNTDRRTKTVEKTKDLLGCSDREGYRMAMQSVTYNVPSSVKSLPLMKSLYDCKQTLNLKTNTMQRSECTEMHVFRPFSYGSSGAMTSNTQTLTYRNSRSSDSAPKGDFNRRTNLLFEHKYNDANNLDSGIQIEVLLNELCQKASNDVRPEVPEIFNKLIDSMRDVSRDVLFRTYRQVTRRNFCAANPEGIKKYFLDAIPMVGTTASVQMIQELIAMKEITGNDAEVCLLSLSFIPHPTREMVAAVRPLLDESNVSGNTILAVSSLASSYCNVRPECGYDSEIINLINKLLEMVGNCNGDVSKTVFGLRGLGNVGHSDRIVSRLSQCMTRKNTPMEVKLAAINAFRRVPCDAMRSDLVGVFRDESEDPELRINAYLAIMNCPTEFHVSEIHQILMKEKSNQVGTFVWSHLTNLMTTSDPHMQKISELLQDEELKKVFNLDQRKFSRNYETSFFFKTINTGAKIDSNVIFSPKSFVPRSANLNLTIDLFGHAINFFEVGGRVQGVERILENYFGSASKSRPTMKAQGLGKLQNDRIDMGMDDFSASAYMRVFGNELRYWNDKDLKNLHSSIGNLLRIGNMSFKKSMVLVDTRLIVPTCIGLPLNLTVTATGSISMEAKGDRRVGAFNAEIKPSASIQVRGEMCVDAFVSKAGLKMVTVAHSSTGVKLNMDKKNIALDFPQKKMDIFNLKSEFYIIHRNAEKKQNMLAGSMKKYHLCTPQSLKSVTGLSFCQDIQFPNASLHRDSPYFPFTGPVVLDLSMMKEDAPNGYKINMDYDPNMISFLMDTPGSKTPRRISLDGTMRNGESKIVLIAPWRKLKLEATGLYKRYMKSLNGRLTFDGNQEYSVLAQLDMKDTNKFVPLLKISSPKKMMVFAGNVEYVPRKSLGVDLSAKGFTTDDISLNVDARIIPKEITATGSLNIGKKPYTVTTRLGKTVKKGGFEYTPYLKVSFPKKDLIELSSKVSYEPNKMAFDMKLDKVLFKPVTLDGVLVLNSGKAKTRNTIMVSFKSPQGNFKLTGNADKKKSMTSSRIIFAYDFGPQYSDRLTLSSKIKDQSTKKSLRYSGNVELVSKKMSVVNFDLNGKVAKTANHLDSDFVLHYGNPSNMASNTLTFKTVINRQLKSLSQSYDFELVVKHKGQNVDFQLKADHFRTTVNPIRKVEFNGLMKINPENIFKTGLLYRNVKVKNLQNTEVSAKLSYPGRDMMVLEKLTQVSRDVYDNLVTVQWQKGQQVSVKSGYKNNELDVHNVENTFTFPNGRKATINAKLQISEGNYKAKVELDAEEQTIFTQQINYMADSSMKYTMSDRRMSGDVSLDLMWEPNKKISATASADYVKGSMISNRIRLSTPFDTVKTVHSNIQFKWDDDNKNYASTVHMNWNNNVMNQNITLNYPDIVRVEFVYSVNYAFHNSNSFNTDINLKGFGSDNVVTLVSSRNGKKIIDLMASHTFRRQVTTTIKLMIFDIKSNFDITLGVSDTGIISNGNVQLQLPSYGFRLIKGSYKLKSNYYTHSVEMSYTTSHSKFRNGRMLLDITEGLPTSFKSTMKLFHNERPFFNFNGVYKRQRNNFDVSVEVTDPKSQTSTVSYNLNLSGDRKTTHIEIKSPYIEGSVDGGFEFQAGRKLDGEFKVRANRKTFLISTTYKKEGDNHKVTGSMRLPDRRDINVETNLNYESPLTVSLKVDSQDFPVLTAIDIEFAHRTIEGSTLTSGSVKVMPYLETTKVEVGLSTGSLTRGSIKLTTPFETVNEVKGSFSLQGDWITSEKITSNIEINDEKVLDITLNYKVKSINDFTVYMLATTSHPKYDEFLFDLKYKGDLTKLVSSLKVKVDGFMLESNVQHNKMNTRISIKTEFAFIDFDYMETQIIRNGDLSDMTINMLHNVGRSDRYEVNISFKDYGESCTIQIVAPRDIEFNAQWKADMSGNNYNLETALNLGNSKKYKFVALYNHVSKMQIIANIPSYNNEILVLFKGNLESLNVQAKLTHNNNDYEISFSNSDYYHQLNAKISTPYFTDVLSFKLNGILKKFNMRVSFKHNNDVYHMKASNEEFYRVMNFQLSTPRIDSVFHFEGGFQSCKGSFKFTLDNVDYGVVFSSKKTFKVLEIIFTIPKHQIKISSNVAIKKNSVPFEFLALYNKKKFVLDGVYKDLGRKKIFKASAKSPYFDNSLMTTLTGKARKFNFIGTVTHKKENYQLTVSNKDYYKVLDVSFTAPKIKAKINFEGELKKFKSSAMLTLNKAQYKLDISNKNLLSGIVMQLSTPEIGNCQMTFDFVGNLNMFNLESHFSHKEMKYELIVTCNRKKGIHSITANAPQGNLFVKLTGNLQSFIFQSNLNFNNEDYDLKVSSKNYFRVINAKLTTPQYGVQTLLFKVTDQLKNFNGQIKIENNKTKYEAVFTFKNNELRGNIDLPYFKQDINVRYTGTPENFNFVMELMHKGKRYRMNASNKNFIEMIAHLSIPQLRDIDVVAKMNGNIQRGQTTFKASYGEHFFENNSTFRFDGKQYELSTNSFYKILEKSGNFNFSFNYRSEATKYEHTANVNINGWRASTKATINMADNLSATLSISVPSYKQSELKLHITSSGFSNTDITLNLKTPLVGQVTVVYEHSGQENRSFKSKGHIKRDGHGRVFGYEADVTYSDNYAFNLKLDSRNARDTINLKTSYTPTNRRLAGGFNILSAFEISDKSHEFNIDVKWSRNNYEFLAELQMDLPEGKRKYQIETTYKNNDQGPDTSRKFELQIIHPEHVITINSLLEKTSNMFSAAGNIYFGQAVDKKFGFDINLDYNSKGILKVITPYRNIEASGALKTRRNQNSYAGYLNLNAGRSNNKIEVKCDIVNSGNMKDIDLIVKFPTQKNGMRLKTSITRSHGDTIFSSKSEFSVDQDPTRTVKADIVLKNQNSNYTLSLSAEHPHTNFASNVVFHVAYGGDRYSAGMNAAYTNYRRRQQNLVIRGQIYRLRREINLEIEAPSKKIEITGAMNSYVNYQMSLKKKESGVDDMKASVFINTDTKHMEIDINHDPEFPKKAFRVEAGLQKNNKVHFEAYRTMRQGKVMTDGKLSIELTPTDSIYTVIHWNPELLEELNIHAFYKMRQLGKFIKDTTETISGAVRKEASEKIALIKRSFNEDLQPLMNYFSREYQGLAQDISSYVRDLKKIYNKNNFYLKTIAESIETSWSYMWEQYNVMVDMMFMQFEEFDQMMTRNMNVAMEYFNMFKSDVSDFYEIYSDKVTKQIDEIQSYMVNMYNEAYATYVHYEMVARYYGDYSRHLKDLMDSIRRNPYGAKLINKFVELYEMFNEKKTQALVHFDGMTSTIYAAHATLNRHISSMGKMKIMKLANEVYQQLLWAYRYWEVKDNFLGLKTKVYNYFTVKLNEVKQTLTDLKWKYVNYDPKKGDIIVEFRFGAAKALFNHFMSFTDAIQEMNVALKLAINKIPSGNMTLWDVYYMMKPSTDVANWIPPFKAHATLFGGQHFTTFDGLHYDFKGICSYVLTRDFADGNFTVVAKFNPDRSQKALSSITVTTALSEQVEIHSDYKVTINGRSTDLPLKLTDATVYRKGDMIIVESPRGYKVISDLYLNLYTVEISGWYFGRVAGLFGTYTNEQYDDISLPNENFRTTTNLEKFAAAWSVSQCRGQNNFANSYEEANEECRKLFIDSSSEFRNCFLQVKPDSFYHACAVQLASAYATENDLCIVSSYYLRQCQRRGVYMNLPKTCGCTSPEGIKFQQGDEMTTATATAPTSADVIIVLQEDKCNKEVGSRLYNMIRILNYQLERSGIRNNMFGLVGFGGDLVESEYMHTMDGKLMSNSARIGATLNKVNYREGNGDADVMKAVNRALQYPTRNGVRNAIILVTCSSCERSNINARELEDLLKKHDITMFMMGEHSLKITGNDNDSPKTTHLYGVDYKETFSKSDVEFDQKSIIMPTDRCVKMALNTGGAYMESVKLARGVSTRSFSAIFADRVLSSVKMPSCQKCHCLVDETGVSRNVCTKCEM